jgi:site-specific recombinase XerD
VHDCSGYVQVNGVIPLQSMAFLPSSKHSERAKMKNSTSVHPVKNGAQDTLSRDELEGAIDGWLLDSEARLSSKTFVNRRFICHKLLWWLDREKFVVCGKTEITRFVIYLRISHKLPEGRWQHPGLPPISARHTTEMRPRSIANYYRWLRTFFLWAVENGYLDVSPLRTMRPPAHRDDQIQPFTVAQIQALLRAAKQSRHNRRDEALVLLLLDTGARAAEICGLTRSDFSLREMSVRLRGKGDTHRYNYLSISTVHAIENYLRVRGDIQDDDALFGSERVGYHGGRLTPDGLGQIVRRLGVSAGISGVRCSPHTFRHTFATMSLRNGAELTDIQAGYGHTTTEMTRRYTLLTGNDQKRRHRNYSPVTLLKNQQQQRRGLS